MPSLRKAKNKAKAKAVNFAAKKLYGADVIEAVAQDCLSAGFMDSLKEWMEIHQDDADFSVPVGTDSETMYPPECAHSPAYRLRQKRKTNGHTPSHRYMVVYNSFKAFSDAQIESKPCDLTPEIECCTLTAGDVWMAGCAGFVTQHKKTVPQFMEMMAKVSDAAPQVQAFIDILSASSEFPVFVDMMTNRERRDYFFFVMKSWRLE